MKEDGYKKQRKRESRGEFNMVKLLSCILLLLASFSSFSQVDDECPEKPDYIVFDEVDMRICELIIDHGLSNIPESANSAVASIYTEKHLYDERDYWVASFVFDNGVSSYYLYNRKENKVNAINLGEFTKQLQAVNRCNNRPEIPLFKKVFEVLAFERVNRLIKSFQPQKNSDNK